MPRDNFNHVKEWRPLLGGIAIQSRGVGQLGTLGFIGTSDGVDRWIVSCRHVLYNSSGPSGTGVEAVFQPYSSLSPIPVAETVPARASAALDCAAAIITAAPARGAIFGMGRLGQAKPPLLGMRVLKSGSATGLTEGVILAMNGIEVEIGCPGFPPDYTLSEPADSGSLWVEADSLSPVAMHYAGNVAGDPERAYGRAIQAVLSALALRILVE